MAPSTCILNSIQPEYGAEALKRTSRAAARGDAGHARCRAHQGGSTVGFGKRLPCVLGSETEVGEELDRLDRREGQRRLVDDAEHLLGAHPPKGGRREAPARNQEVDFGGE